MLKGSSSQLMASHQCVCGAHSVFFKGLNTGSLTMQYILDLLGFSFSIFLGGRLDLGGMGSECDGVQCMKFPNN